MSATITYSGLTSVTLDLGTGGDNLTIFNTAAAIPTVVNTDEGNDTVNVRATSGPTTVYNLSNTGGTDTFNVGSLEPLPGGVLTGIAAPLSVYGGGAATLNVDDTGNFSGDTGTLTNSLLTGMGMAGSIGYEFLTTLNILLGSGADTLLVLSTAAVTATTVYAGPGNDTVNVRAVGGPTMIVTGTGADVVNIGSLEPVAGGILTGIAAGLTVLGSGNATVNADDTGNMAGDTGTLTATMLTGLGMAGSVTYTGLAAMNVRLGPGGDTFPRRQHRQRYGHPRQRQ